jgi:hypothetical protein
MQLAVQRAADWCARVEGLIEFDTEAVVTAACRPSGRIIFAGFPVALPLHLGNRPGPARQAAVVGKQRTLSLSRLRWAGRMAHTWAGMAAGWPDRVGQRQ